MRAIPRGSERLRWGRLPLASLALGLTVLCGCSDDPSAQDPVAMGSLPPSGSGGMTASPPPLGSAPAAKPVVIDGFGRAPGMAIGNGVPDDPGGDDDGPSTTPAPTPVADSDDIVIPTFEETPAPPIIPCTGCVELSAILDDINQRSDFLFNVGSVPTTRVIWTLLLSFNSDQLFIRSIVNGSEGPYTPMSANIFGQLNTPVQFVHAFTGTATSLGIAFGSQGAWTGEQRISVFVDSVTLEGANGTSRTFDADAGGFAARGTERQPMVQFH